jgi:glyoxylase-like metal-dependent hydrolase (beta-lactamase superfamily II)
MNCRRGLFLLLVGCFILLLAGQRSIAQPDSSLKVSYINVGQGDAALLSDETGFYIPIDGGKPTAGPTVLAYLREQGIDVIEVLLVTHADADHVGVSSMCWKRQISPSVRCITKAIRETPPVWPDQPRLGWKTLAHLRDHPGMDLQYDHSNRLDGQCLFECEEVPERYQDRNGCLSIL